MTADAQAVERLLTAQAIGDSLGFPAEGLKPDRIRSLGWNPWRQRFFFGCGVVSDDTDHAVMTAQAIRESEGDVELFRKLLARRLKRWFLAMPPGIGLATLRSSLRLVVGVSPKQSGVWSAGNGPAMRSPVIGAAFATDKETRHAFVEASTLMTHTDPRALIAARAVADCVAWALSEPDLDSETIVARLSTLNPGDEAWSYWIESIDVGLAGQISTTEFANALGLEDGVTGFAYHTVPVAIFAWLRYRGDFRAGLESVLDCGGDTDTVGAIHAALASVDLNSSNKIPDQWSDWLSLWPRNQTDFDNFGGEIDSIARLWLRNLITLIAVLFHGFVLRLLPAGLVRIFVR